MQGLCAHPHVIINKTKLDKLFEQSSTNATTNVSNFDDLIAKSRTDNAQSNHGFLHSVKEALRIDEVKTPLFLAAIGLGVVSGSPQKVHLPRMTHALSEIILESNKIINEKVSIQRQLILYVFIGDLINEITAAWHELSLLNSNIVSNPKSYFLEDSELQALYVKLANPILNRNGFNAHSTNTIIDNAMLTVKTYGIFSPFANDCKDSVLELSLSFVFPADHSSCLFLNKQNKNFLINPLRLDSNYFFSQSVKNLLINLGGHRFMFLQHPVARISKNIQAIRTADNKLFLPKKRDGSLHFFSSICKHKNISSSHLFNFSQGSILMHDACSLTSYQSHFFMKRELKVETLAISHYLPLIAESEGLLDEFVLNHSTNLFQKSDSLISPDRLAKLHNLSMTAQKSEVKMQKEIDDATSLSWFDRCIKLLAQFCLAIACTLMLCVALVIGLKVCALFCNGGCWGKKESPSVIVLDKKSTATHNDNVLDLSYKTLHRHLADDSFMTNTHNNDNIETNA